MARERTGGGRRKPLLRARTFPGDAPVLPHLRTLPEGMRLEASELKGPVAPSKALSSCPIYFHIRLMTVKSLILKRDYPECSALMGLILPPSGAQTFKGISVHSPLPYSWLWKSPRSCDLIPSWLLFQSPPKAIQPSAATWRCPTANPPRSGR